jgi:hypothetical protein
MNVGEQSIPSRKQGKILLVDCWLIKEYQGLIAQESLCDLRFVSCCELRESARIKVTWTRRRRCCSVVIETVESSWVNSTR